MVFNGNYPFPSPNTQHPPQIKEGNALSKTRGLHIIKQHMPHQADILNNFTPP